MPKYRSAIQFLLMLLLAGMPTVASSEEWVSDELLVRFNDDTEPEVMAAINASIGGRVIGTFQGDNFLFQLRLDDAAALERTIAAYASRPEVKYAQKNFVYRAQLMPNDARFGELWGMHNTGQSGGTVDADVDAPEAWDKFTGSFTYVIADIDTGVDYNHEDLLLNAWTNLDEIPANGIDDDANGFVDDIHGYDFVNNDGNPIDDHDHGSHTAGTFGGSGNNLIGVTGANWNVQVMALKFLNQFGSGNTANAVRAVDYATNNGARVSNNSWGGGGFDQALLDAIQRANAAGVAFIAAAGNSSSNNDLGDFYPCNYGKPGTNEAPNVICVAATDRNDNMANFSSYGATTVDLGAPGVSTLSTVRNNGYSSFSGTSMATPHVVGAYALVQGCNGALGVSDVKQILLDTVRPIPTLNGRTVTGGVVNYDMAIHDFRVGACGGGGDPNNPPTADVGGPYSGHRGRPVQFDGTGSTDSDGTVVSYQWSFGDGTSGSGPRPTHTYLNGGTYTVRLTVRDDKGASSAPSQTTATIKGRRQR